MINEQGKTNKVICIVLKITIFVDKLSAKVAVIVAIKNWKNLVSIYFNQK
jgi:hypothetical protein